MIISIIHGLIYRLSHSRIHLKLHLGNDRCNPGTMVLKNCCCCLDLRIGCMVIAILQIFVGLGHLGRTPFTWNVFLGATLGVACGVVLLYGTIKNNQTATTIYLVFAVIAIVVHVIAAILIFVAVKQVAKEMNEIGENTDATVTEKEGNIIGIVLLIVALVEVYLWICVYSFLKEVKLGAYAV